MFLVIPFFPGSTSLQISAWSDMPWSLGLILSLP